MTRKELFKNTLRKSVHAWKLITELPLSDDESLMLRSFMDQPGFLDLHWVKTKHTHKHSPVSLFCLNAQQSFEFG